MADFGETQRSCSICGGYKPVERTPLLVNSFVLKDKWCLIWRGGKPGSMLVYVLKYS